jgi:hypothetical protein
MAKRLTVYYILAFWGISSVVQSSSENIDKKDESSKYVDAYGGRELSLDNFTDYDDFYYYEDERDDTQNDEDDENDTDDEYYYDGNDDEGDNFIFQDEYDDDDYTDDYTDGYDIYLDEYENDDFLDEYFDNEYGINDLDGYYDDGCYYYGRFFYCVDTTEYDYDDQDDLQYDKKPYRGGNLRG